MSRLDKYLQNLYNETFQGFKQSTHQLYLSHSFQGLLCFQVLQPMTCFFVELVNTNYL